MRARIGLAVLTFAATPGLAGGCKESSGGGTVQAKKAARPPAGEDNGKKNKVEGYNPDKPLPEDVTAAWEKQDKDGKPKPHGIPWDYTFTFRNTPPTKDGPFTMKWPDGKARLKGTMCKGSPCGKWVAFYRSGKKHREGTYEGGVQHGTWRAWYESGARRGQGQYKNDMAYGLFFEWHPSDNLWQKYNWHMDGGRLHGPWVMLHDDGTNSEEGAYDEGQPDEVWRIWHKNGQLEEKMTWVKGKENGPITIWNDSGAVIARGKFNMAVAIAPWECRDKDGKMVTAPTPQRPRALPSKVCADAGYLSPQQPEQDH